MSNLPTLTTDTIWAILNEEIDDATVNQLVWHYLGYQYDEASGQWDNTNVEAAWREDYPEPPNFIDSRPATVKLTRIRFRKKISNCLRKNWDSKVIKLANSVRDRRDEQRWRIGC